MCRLEESRCYWVKQKKSTIWFKWYCWKIHRTKSSAYNPHVMVLGIESVQGTTNIMG